MCGIVGIVSLAEGASVDAREIRTMADLIRHRGPDGEGYFVRPNVALGNVRLSVIDLAGGKQPISTPDGRYTIVFNGEIFNYKPLREELVKKGVRFRTESDTEVVVAGFAKEGISFLDRLDGMFSFLIYDSSEDVLLAGRDPFGIKPLYQVRQGDRIYFASEIKALRKVMASRAVHMPSLHSLVRLGYVTGRKTMLEGVERVSPGAILKVSPQMGVVEEAFVSRLLPTNLALRQRMKHDLKRTVVSAVERSLVADVPVGLYLSGGIDSSLIAGIVKKELGQTLQSFSISFPDDQSFNEGPAAKMVADELGLPNETISVGPEDFMNLRSLAATLEEPMADPSAVALGKLSALASKHLKVVLSGEGGDELFGGYHRYFWDRFASRYHDAPWTIRKMGDAAASLFPFGRFGRRAKKLRDTADMQRHRRYMSWFAAFRPEENVLLDHAPQNAEYCSKIFEGAFDFSSPLSETAQAQWVDLVTFLRDDLLVKADKMSMAHGLEGRVPFLQAGVVEAAFSVEDRQRVRARESKPVLRVLLREYLPSSIVDRKKQGFEVPIGAWLKGPLKPLLDEHLSKSVVEKYGLLNGATVETIVAEHLSGHADRGLALYSLCLLQAWCEEWLM